MTDSGLRVEIEVGGDISCPMMRASVTNGCSCQLLSRSFPEQSSGRVLEIFLADSGIEVDKHVEPVFAYRSRSVYRAQRDRDIDCPCERLSRLGYSLDSVRVEAGDMSVVTHLKDMDELQQAVDELRDHYGKVVVQRLVRVAEDRLDHEFAMFDLGELTDRQREVLETAYEMGYFEHPRRANAGEVASELDINRSTFAQHLSSAQRKIVASLLGD